MSRYDPRTLGLASQTWHEDFAMKGLQEVVEEINKIKPETSRNLKAMFGSIERMGRSNMLAPIRQSLMMPGTQFGLQAGMMMQNAMMPVTIGLNQLVHQVNMAITPLVEQNRTGAMIGGGIGLIGYFWGPGVGALTTTAFSLLGAGAQATAGAGAGLDPTDQYSDWEQMAREQGLGTDAEALTSRTYTRSGEFTTPTVGGHRVNLGGQAAGTQIGSRDYGRVL